MDALWSLVLALAMINGSDGAWCVCKSGGSNSDLQKALDYACGAGADCDPIHQKGACYNPNTVIDHCSYAANSYYQRKGQAQGACDFAGTAGVTSSDPSTGNGCIYPPNPSSAGTSTSIANTTPGSSTTPGLGPSTSFDDSDAGPLTEAKMGSLLPTFTFSLLFFLKV